jgi:hypothetical protein
LTNTLFAEEPDLDEDRQHRWIANFDRHYMRGPAISMLPVVRMDNIQHCVVDVIERGVPGDLIETGVWRGGATIFMRGILKSLGVTDRKVWVADSFEGLPVPDADKYPIEAKARQGVVINKIFKQLAVGLEEVQDNFRAFGLLDDQVQFLKGWFCDTLPHAPIGTLAVMRLDGDFYESTMDSLTNLYDKLSVGGYVIIDDYGESDWTYCRKAVEEFRTSRGITTPLVTVDSRCSYWQRQS